MKSAKKIRLGVIGAGGITKNRHLPNLKRISRVELVAVCNRSEASSSAVAKEWGFQRICKTPSEIIHAKDIDAVMIGTWPYMHCALSCAALKAGKHVFTQARMASNLSEARRMRDAARRHSHWVAMICPSPYALQQTLYIQKLLKNGFVGKIRLVQFQSLNAAFARSENPIHWRQQRHFNGLNTLSYGIIIERFLQWFGPIESVQVIGSIFTSKRKDASEKKWVRVTNPDQLQVIAQLRNHPGQLNLSFSGAIFHAPSDRVEIYGDRGTLVLNSNQLWGAKAGDKKLKILIPPKRMQSEWTVEADFIDAIRFGQRHHPKKKEPHFFPPDFDEGFRYMAVIEATMKAGKSHQRERISNE